MDFSFLVNTPLFRGIREEDLITMLSCLGAHEKCYCRDEIIYHAGDAVTDIGLVLSGSVNTYASFVWGSSQIIGHAGSGDIFAESHAAIPGKELPGDIAASEDSSVLFIDINRLLNVCPNTCAFHSRLIRNMVKLYAAASLRLSARMMYTAPRSIRNRLLVYLSDQSRENGSMRFTVPFSRQQMADYLGVDRSAMSNELSKLQKEGLITYRKNEFVLNWSNTVSQ
ncbi:MAG: Crp/Fnr family transcriptional regulator [Mailhella sp.]|nr:Crp/Fnr family transcriptional regulator [Mailhella sp.]